MKTVTYKCDHCERIHYSDESIISIGSNSGDKLYYKNPSYSRNQKILIDNMHDLNFCNKECFTNYFFDVHNKTNQ